MTNFNEDPKKFTVGEIAKILGAREETVRNWISSGQLKGTKENGQWLVTLQKAPKGTIMDRLYSQTFKLFHELLQTYGRKPVKKETPKA